MAGPWDAPPTDAERVDPWASPPTDAERVRADTPSAKAAPAPAEKRLEPEENGLQAWAAHLADNIPGARQLATAVLAAKMGLDGSPVGFGENYKQLRLAEDRNLQQSKVDNPGLSLLGSLMGFGGTVAAAPATTAAGLAALGGITGLSDATNDPSATGGDILRRTAISTAAAPILGKTVETLAPLAARGLSGLGGAAENLAGWLKVNSIHPNPKLGEAMEELPGGKVGVGLELLKQGIGGLTKGGTAKQTELATSAAGKTINAIANAYDASGGKAIDLNPALADGLQHAAKLQAEPTTKAAGQKLEDLIYEYAAKYRGQPVPASEALAMKRALAAAAYKHGAAAKVGDTVAGDFGAGMAKLERSVDDALDQHLGPSFEGANLSFRRLLKASSATDRQEARGASNHLVGLLPLIAGVGGAGVGHASGEAGPLAVGAGLGTLLLGKYGAQAGARMLYSPVAGGINSLGALLSRTPAVLGSQMAAGQVGSMSPTLAELLAPRPAAAQGVAQ